MVSEEGVVTPISYQCVLSGFTRFWDLTPAFFQSSFLRWLQKMQSFIATLKLKISTDGYHTDSDVSGYSPHCALKFLPDTTSHNQDILGLSQ